MPVGVPLPDFGVTVAVNVTNWPKTDGLAEELTVIVVAVFVTGDAALCCPSPKKLSNTAAINV